jgi:hypothetical protein
MADIIPFGKYRGQPLAALSTDRAYCDWLLTQPWFVQRHPDIHAIVINHFGEPSETPEHNALQLRFLDRAFQCKATSFFAGQERWSRYSGDYQSFDTQLFSLISSPTFEDRGIDVSWQIRAWHISHYISNPYKNTHKIEWSESDYSIIGIECKPFVGDDYPAILRFMKNLPMHTHMLVAGHVESQVASLEAMKEFFRLSGIKLVLVEEIEQALPAQVSQKAQLPSAHALYQQCIPVPCTACATALRIENN